MSYTPPPSGYLVPQPSSAGPERPGTVTIAATLLYAMAALQLLSFVLGLLQLGPARTAVADLYPSGAQADTMEAAMTVGLVIGAVVALVFGALFVVCGVFVGKGRQWARITSWVVGGLMLCCGAAGLAGSALQGMMPTPPAGSGPTQAEVQSAIATATPGWITGISYGVQIIAICAALGVVILLALPPSHDFFRKRQPEWVPPTYPAV